MKNNNWEMFVKDFVGEVDYDIAKQLDPATAEVAEDAEEFLAELVEAAKRLAGQWLGNEKIA